MNICDFVAIQLDVLPSLRDKLQSIDSDALHILVHQDSKDRKC